MNFLQLSKAISHALRHEPQLYNLTIDNEGWVNISDLVVALIEKGLDVSQEDIIKMVDTSEKKRHQIFNNKIRAFYGHSTNDKIIKHSQMPPDILYHGTVRDNIDSIIINGLLPMKRQYVHLSIDEETAKLVAMRHKGEVIICKIKAKEAHMDGVFFYKENGDIWLSEPISAQYIIF